MEYFVENNLSGLKREDFQKEINGKKTDLFILKNKCGNEVALTNYGGALLSIMVPDKVGNMQDVLIGYSNIADYATKPSDFGASVGRYANRIANGVITIDDVVYDLPKNNFGHCLHGGCTLEPAPMGWQNQVFDVEKVTDNQIVRDSSWAVIGSAVSKCAAMVVSIIIARLLGVEEFGEYGMVKTTLFYIAVFSTFGLGSTATRYMAQCDADDHLSIYNLIRNSISITLITSTVMAVLLFTCAHLITDEPHLISILRYTSLIVIFNAINTTQLGLLCR